jgi:hypothetical protein
MGERSQTENQDYGFAAVLNCTLSNKKELTGAPMSFGFQLTK